MLIAQITDLHIRPEGQLVYRRVDTATYLTRCVTHLNHLVPAPDLVLITGDLVDTGKAAAYGYLRELLRPLAIPHLVIPGNHDHRELLRQAFHDHDYLRQNESFIHYAINDFPLRFVGLDTTIPNEDGGRLCRNSLSWLQDTLNEARARPTYLFLHHPPFATGLSFMDGYGCEGGDQLAELLALHRQVIGLTCGHVHRAIHRQWSGIAASISPGPAHAFELELAGRGDLKALLEPPACLLHRWTGEAGLTSYLSFIGTFPEVLHHDPASKNAV